MQDAIGLIVKQLDRIERNQCQFQEKTADQLAQMSARLAVVEYEVKEINGRINSANNCAEEIDEEINRLQIALERLEGGRWNRGDKIKATGIAISAVFALAALVISVIFH